MVKTISYFILFILIGHFSFAQSGKANTQLETDTIPFDLSRHNNIIIKAILNESDTLKLMLHTAVNEVSLTKEATSRIASIRFDEADSVSSWGGNSESRYSLNNSLAIGQYNWENVGIWESKHSGHNTDGKFGLNLFEDGIIELDFNTSQLIIHSSLPRKSNTYEKLKYLDKNGLIFIRGECIIENKAYENKFLVHTGYSGSILLDDEFVMHNKMSEKMEVLSESILKDSYGNELKTINAILPYFRISELNLQDVPVGFFEGSINRQKMSVLGGDVLKRFNLIFDLKSSTLYMQSNDLYSGSYYLK